jgi:hypothetical protein
MTTPNFPDAAAFHHFLGEQLHVGGEEKSPEELLALWRAEHPTPEQLQESVAALREAIADMEAGDAGRPASEVIGELLQKYNLPPEMQV